jgi:hypothetical protein
VRVRIRDTTRLRFARLFLDGRRKHTTRAKRFTVPIPAARLRSGRHRITVTASDRAGNRGRRSVRFNRCPRATRRQAAVPSNRFARARAAGSFATGVRDAP